MSQTGFTAAISRLQGIEGVAGILFFRGAETLHCDLPFSGGRTDALRGTVTALLEGYRHAGRTIRQIYLEFNEFRLLIATEEEAVLVTCLTPAADTALTANAASLILRNHATGNSGKHAMTAAGNADTKQDHWAMVRQSVEGVLGKIMGRAQASNLVDRTLAVSGWSRDDTLSAADARTLAAKVMEHIPNLSRRRQLLAELAIALDSVKN